MPLLSDLLKPHADRWVADNRHRLPAAIGDEVLAYELAKRAADKLRRPVLKRFEHHGLDAKLDADVLSLSVDAVAAWRMGWRTLQIFRLVRELPSSCNYLPPRRLAKAKAVAFYAAVMAAARNKPTNL